jgi:hypothetical protein
MSLHYHAYHSLGSSFSIPAYARVADVEALVREWAKIAARIGGGVTVDHRSPHLGYIIDFEPVVTARIGVESCVDSLCPPVIGRSRRE